MNKYSSERRAVFLDRDGVLNYSELHDGKPYAPREIESFHLLPDALSSTEALHKAGLLLIVATNQPDVGNGIVSKSTVEAMHDLLKKSLPIDAIKVCFHSQSDNCSCRKPKSGMLLEASQELNIDLAKSFMVGDRCGDVTAGKTQGCYTIFIDRGYSEPLNELPNATVASLTEATELILALLKNDDTKGDQMNKLSGFNVKIFADGADMNSILELYKYPYIKGFTTNPTLMRKAGVTDYEVFSRELIAAVPDQPISLEVFADDFLEMEKQAYRIASWGKNVYVKIPITNTKKESSCPLIARLSSAGVQLNVTAILTLDQVQNVANALSVETPAIVSVFAGRIADTGVDPVPMMLKSLDILKGLPRAELLWASPRQMLNIIQANEIGCHIITVTSDVLKKLSLLGKDLEVYSLETVEMFYNDALAAEYSITTENSEENINVDP